MTIRWTFKISSYNFTALVLPYAGATSGAQYKYAISTDLASGTPITISSSANPLIITKTSDKTVYLLNTTASFTVTIQNPAAYAVSIDKITDQVPVGFVYQGLSTGSGVTTTNSTSYPSTSATGTISFEGGVASGSTASYVVPAGGNLVLKYTAVAPLSVTANLTTTAAGFIGTTQFGSAQNTVSVSTTLPVNIQSFNGDFVNDGVKLRWTTSSEIGSSYFEVQRSVDGSGFSKIGIVNASGNSSLSKSYSFVDTSVLAGKNYYRLKMVDINGDIKYSNIISLKQGDNASFFEALANPFHDKLQMKIKLRQKQDVQIKLFDGKGVAVVQQTFHGEAGVNLIELSNIGGLPKGIYFLEVNADGKLISKQVVKN